MLFGISFTTLSKESGVPEFQEFAQPLKSSRRARQTARFWG
jgi:hypothetical protein